MRFPSPVYRGPKALRRGCLEHDPWELGMKERFGIGGCSCYPGQVYVRGWAIAAVFAFLLAWLVFDRMA